MNIIQDSQRKDGNLSVHKLASNEDHYCHSQKLICKHQVFKHLPNITLREVHNNFAIDQKQDKLRDMICTKIRSKRPNGKVRRLHSSRLAILH